MTKCRWDREFSDYLLPDGTVCRGDEYGDPTRHCTAKKGCANHVGASDLTCARCIGRARTNIKRIALLAPLALPVALEVGSLNSEAVNLAGPAADPRGWAERREAMYRHLDTWTDLERITWEQHAHALAAMPDDDELHPYGLLTRWHMMLAQDYGLSLPPWMSISGSATALDVLLHRVAQDSGQDFPQLAYELRKCRQHLETALRTARRSEKGAPCPACIDAGEEKAPRLARNYGHWCDDEACEQIHYSDDSGDWWECPRNHDHQWSHEDYKLRVDEWYDETRDGRMGA